MHKRKALNCWLEKILFSFRFLVHGTVCCLENSRGTHTFYMFNFTTLQIFLELIIAQTTGDAFFFSFSLIEPKYRLSRELFQYFQIPFRLSYHVSSLDL